ASGARNDPRILLFGLGLETPAIATASPEWDDAFCPERSEKRNRGRRLLRPSRGENCVSTGGRRGLRRLLGFQPRLYDLGRRQIHRAEGCKARFLRIHARWEKVDVVRARRRTLRGDERVCLQTRPVGI